MASARTWMAGVTKVALVYEDAWFQGLEGYPTNAGLGGGGRGGGPAFQVYDGSSAGGVACLTFFALALPTEDDDDDDALGRACPPNPLLVNPHRALGQSQPQARRAPIRCSLRAILSATFASPAVDFTGVRRAARRALVGSRSGGSARRVHAGGRAAVARRAVRIGRGRP